MIAFGVRSHAWARPVGLLATRCCRRTACNNAAIAIGLFHLTSVLSLTPHSRSLTLAPSLAPLLPCPPPSPLSLSGLTLSHTYALYAFSLFLSLALTHSHTLSRTLTHSHSHTLSLALYRPADDAGELPQRSKLVVARRRRRHHVRQQHVALGRRHRERLRRRVGRGAPVVCQEQSVDRTPVGTSADLAPRLLGLPRVSRDPSLRTAPPQNLHSGPCPARHN